MKPIHLLLPLAFVGRLLAAGAEPLPDGIYAEFTTPHGVVVAELFATPPAQS